MQAANLDRGFGANGNRVHSFVGKAGAAVLYLDMAYGDIGGGACFQPDIRSVGAIDIDGRAESAGKAAVLNEHIPGHDSAPMCAGLIDLAVDEAESGIAGVVFQKRAQGQVGGHRLGISRMPSTQEAMCPGV